MMDDYDIWMEVMEEMEDEFKESGERIRRFIEEFYDKEKK